MSETQTASNAQNADLSLSYYNLEDDETLTLPRVPPPTGTTTPIRDDQNMRSRHATYGNRVPSPDSDEDDTLFDVFEDNLLDIDTLLRLPRYNEAGSESDSSDDDETDEKCLICCRRKATISFPSCCHQLCVSCTKQCWWAAVAHELHWPTEMPCPFCRGAITAVIEAGGSQPVLLVRWIRRRSSAARVRFIGEEMNRVYQERGNRWYRQYQAEQQRTVNNLERLNIFLLVMFIIVLLISMLFMAHY